MDTELHCLNESRVEIEVGIKSQGRRPGVENKVKILFVIDESKMVKGFARRWNGTGKTKIAYKQYLKPIEKEERRGRNRGGHTLMIGE